ncbi:MAG: hypothetical protein AAGA54_04975 [Myxococcota bacterium]
MIKAALRLQVRTVLRSPARLLGVVFVLAVGLFVVWQGGQDVARWNEAIAQGRRAEAETIEEARALLKAGEAGPAQRPWVDLHRAAWQDRYAAVRLAKRPAPLAGIAFASADATPAVQRIDRRADPMIAAGSRIENPALVVTGGLDLVTVLSLLLPLCVVALGVDVGGYERASGVLSLVRVQSGDDLRWIRARCIAVGVLVAGLGLLLVVSATVVLGGAAEDALRFSALVLAYVAVWTALMSLVATVARHPSHGAIALGVAWMALCVLVPAVAAERSASLVAEDFALDLTVERRNARGRAAELDADAVWSVVTARFPSLAAEATSPDPSVADDARDVVRLVDLEARLGAREQRGGAQRQLVERASISTPTVAFASALERLAGRGPVASLAFRRAVIEAAAARAEETLARRLRDVPLGLSDFDALVASSPTHVEPPAPGITFELAILLGWTLALLGAGAWLGRRPSR